MKATFLTWPATQELAEGRSLAQLVEEGWRADEAEVTRIGTELLEILEYLGSRRPSVTHRCGCMSTRQISYSRIRLPNLWGCSIAL